MEVKDWNPRNMIYIEVLATITRKNVEPPYGLFLVGRVIREHASSVCMELKILFVETAFNRRI